jgi:FxsC-like protein
MEKKMSDYLYFLSYARNDRDNDQYDTIRRFARELEQQVRMLRPGQDSVSFFDGNDIEPGDSWPPTLSEALCRSKVFVPIYSPTYFTKDYCGREWQVFRNRLDAYRRQNPDVQVDDLIQPVLLMAPRDLPSLPDACSNIQYVYDQYPKKYRTDGLRAIRRSGAALASYSDFLIALARRIVEVSEGYSQPPLDPCPDIQDITSAFHGLNAQTSSMGSDVSQTRGPRYVQFIFVAGKRSELQGIRQGLDCYGPSGGLDWQPFLPPVQDEVALLAQEVAVKEKLFYETVPLDANIIQKLEEAENRHKLAVIIVDRWTLDLPQYHNYMRQYDDREFINCVVLVPWNQQDDETLSNGSRLTQRIRRTFRKKGWLNRDPSRFLEPISSPDELKQQLSETLHKTRALVIQNMDLDDVKPIRREQVISKPEITGPEG